MNMFHWEVTDRPREKDSAVVAEGVFAHGRLQAQAGNSHQLACFIREDGTIVAGASGRTEFNRRFISQLWVSEPLRRQGLGTKLLSALESHAIKRGCTTSMIETLLEPVARLYESQGYANAATILEDVGPFTRYIMLKQLNTLTASSGA